MWRGQLLHYVSLHYMKKRDNFPCTSSHDWLMNQGDCKLLQKRDNSRHFSVKRVNFQTMSARMTEREQLFLHVMKTWSKEQDSCALNWQLWMIKKRGQPQGNSQTRSACMKWRGKTLLHIRYQDSSVVECLHKDWKVCGSSFCHGILLWRWARFTYI